MPSIPEEIHLTRTPHQDRLYGLILHVNENTHQIEIPPVEIWELILTMLLCMKQAQSRDIPPS